MLVAVAGVVCNSGYVLATRKLAGVDSPADDARLDADRRDRFSDAAAAVGLARPGVALMSGWSWRALGAFGAAGHGLLIVAHKYAPAPVLTPFSYTQLIWMIVSGVLVFGDWPPAATLVGAALVVACGAWLALRERRGRRPRNLYRPTSIDNARS